MAVIELQQTQQKLNKFAAEQWDKTLAYLQGTFSLSRSDCEDIFQEAFIVLYKKNNRWQLRINILVINLFCRYMSEQGIREDAWHGEGTEYH